MNVAKQINEIRQTPGISVRQRNYYEHIIRNETELNDIRQYIINNPLNCLMKIISSQDGKHPFHHHGAGATGRSPLLYGLEKPVDFVFCFGV